LIFSIEVKRSPILTLAIRDLRLIASFCFFLLITLDSFGWVAGGTTAVNETKSQLVQSNSSSVPAKLEEAKQLRDKGDLKGAIAIYQQILDRDPQQKEAKTELALTLAWDNQLDASLNLYRELIKDEPNNIDFLLQIATVYNWKAEYQNAIATYEKILQLDSSNESAKLGLAETYGWNNQFDKAIKIYQDLLILKPKDIQLKLKIAEILTWADRLNAALELYEKIIVQHPEASDAFAKRAEITFWLGKPIKAISLYKKALKLFSNDPKLTVGLAKVYQSQQASGKALKLIEPLVKSGDREATQLLATIKASSPPTLQLGFNSLSDSDDFHSETYTSKFTTAIAPQSKLEFEINRTNLRQPNFELTTTNIYTLSLNQVIDSQWQISTGLGITDFTSDRLWYVRTRWQPTDKITVSAQVNHQPLNATIQAIDNDVSLTSYSLGSDFKLDNNTQFGFGLERTNFNPDNSRDAVFAYANRVIFAKPLRLELGYLFRNLGYEKTPGLGYFSPSRFVQHGALISLNLPLSKDLNIFSRNLLGVQQINEGDRELSLDLTAGLNWQLSPKASVKIQYHYFTISASQGGGGYKADEVSTQLVWNF
jgi:tetratricopeptide (TPR) repeat protein